MLLDNNEIEIVHLRRHYFLYINCNVFIKKYQ